MVTYFDSCRVERGIFNSGKGMVCATSTELYNTARKQLGMNAGVPRPSVTFL